ncbi:MAG: DUF1801 domain-containing protein [Anaeromyxobacteraceae bacterium]
MPAKKPSPGSPIDAYLAKVPAARRPLLAALRERILAAAPEAEECISYGLAAFRVRGKVVAGFQATEQGGSYYPFSGTTLGTLADALEGWSRTKSALHFTAERPIPAALLRKLLKTRLSELDA